jgi:hypothetical protein
LIAANGDSIYTTIVGSSEPTGTPGVRSITEIDTITGGTGRFAGAQGSFIVERLVNQTDFTSGSFHGTITPPGA